MELQEGASFLLITNQWGRPKSIKILLQRRAICATCTWFQVSLPKKRAVPPLIIIIQWLIKMKRHEAVKTMHTLSVRWCPYKITISCRLKNKKLTFHHDNSRLISCCSKALLPIVKTTITLLKWPASCDCQALVAKTSSVTMWNEKLRPRSLTIMLVLSRRTNSSSRNSSQGIRFSIRQATKLHLKCSINSYRALARWTT